MFKEITIYSILTIFVLAISYLYGLLVEMFLFIVFYYFIKALFNKQFHADSIAKRPRIAVILCYCITFTIQILFIFILVKFNISFYSNIYIGISLGLSSFILQDYLDLKFPKAKFYKGMLVNDLPNDLKGIEYDIMFQYYVKRYKLDRIAINLDYSVDNIKKIKAKIIKRYS